MSTNRWQGRMVWLMMVLLLGVYLQVTYWYLWPYKVIEVADIPVSYTNPHGQVEAGGVVNLKIRGEKFWHGGAQISRQLVNDCVVNIYSGFSDLPPGEFNHLVPVEIPAWVPPGKYRLRTTYRYEVNPIRSITYAYDSQVFEVVKP